MGKGKENEVVGDVVSRGLALWTARLHGSGFDESFRDVKRGNRIAFGRSEKRYQKQQDTHLHPRVSFFSFCPKFSSLTKHRRVVYGRKPL